MFNKIDEEMLSVLNDELILKADLGYPYYLDIIRNFKKYEDYKEINEQKEYKNQKYIIHTEILWDDEPEGKIRVFIEVRRPKFFFSDKARDYILIDDGNEITKT
jgi:hypothetical protein